MKNSIQLRLSITLSIAIIVTAIFSGGLTFYLALDEAHELQDDTLSQIAHVMKYTPSQNGVLNKTVQRMEGDADARISMEFIASTGATLAESDLSFNLPRPVADGFQDAIANGRRYRVLVHSLTPQTQVVIGQLTEAREEIAFESALRTLIPLLFLLPVLLLVATDFIRKSFRPVLRLADEVHQRDEHDLTPFAEAHIPDEIRPFVGGINKLLHKVDGAMQAQQRFIADAAHELRTPFTALSLQAERLSEADMPPDAHHRLALLRQGLSRNKNLLEQLLTLARAQLAPQEKPSEPLLVSSLFREVIEAVYPLAEAKCIDIGLVASDEPERRLLTDKNTLYIALKNLTENAIRYIPESSQIDMTVRFTEHEAIIEIEDNGPGIDGSERERVFAAFYRPEGMTEPGSGLGLSIVKVSVERLGGKITLHPAQHFSSGLLARIVLLSHA
ncbi:MAG TPA: ATP-binding protein [Scandinavium sp.]